MASAPGLDSNDKSGWGVKTTVIEADQIIRARFGPQRTPQSSRLNGPGTKTGNAFSRENLEKLVSVAHLRCPITAHTFEDRCLSY